MKKLILILMALAMFAACSFKGGSVPLTYKSTFPGVPYAELTTADKAGPPSDK